MSLVKQSIINFLTNEEIKRYIPDKITDKGTFLYERESKKMVPNPYEETDSEDEEDEKKVRKYSRRIIVVYEIDHSDDDIEEYDSFLYFIAKMDQR
jgi:hypothetical protein